MRKRFLAARSQDAIQRKYDTGKPLRGLRSKWSEAWDASGAPQPLPLAAQKLLVAPAMKRLELANAVDYMGYMSGQIVGRIKDERPIRDIMEDMKAECLTVPRFLGSQA
jgi:NAD(P)H-dependent flavin oxidoreductase YrpB (nitropropane dioxygenase family)